MANLLNCQPARLQIKKLRLAATAAETCKHITATKYPPENDLHPFINRQIKMLIHKIDPVAFSIGGIEMHWYGLMYLIGFAVGWGLARWRASQPHSDWTPEEVDDLLTQVMLGVILGGRLGYVLFYDPAAYFHEPLEIIKIWHGGMSFHGGLLGALAAFWIFARNHHKSFWQVSDFVAPLVPQAIMWGRLGNFINGELWGKVAWLPWSMVFPNAGPEPRHPTQLYEALLEGLVLFIAIWLYSSRPRKPGAVSGFFAIGYALARIMVEFVRVPDAHLGYLAFGWLTMGQILCLPVLAIGVWLMFRPCSGWERHWPERSNNGSRNDKSC